MPKVSSREQICWNLKCIFNIIHTYISLIVNTQSIIESNDIICKMVCGKNSLRNQCYYVSFNVNSSLRLICLNTCFSFGETI